MQLVNKKTLKMTHSAIVLDILMTMYKVLSRDTFWKWWVGQGNDGREAPIHRELADAS